MNKPIVNQLTDLEFSNIVKNSYNINDAAIKMGFAHEPGKSSKLKIKNRMALLGLNFKVKSIIKKESKYNNSKEVGFVGEKAFEYLCAKNNISFYKELTESKPYDYLMNIGGKFLKIQVKTTEFMHNESTIVFDISKTRVKNDGNLKYFKNTYTTNDIDYFFLYCIETETAFLKFNQGAKMTVTLRLNTPKNNSKKCNFYKDYLFENVIKEI